MKEKKYRYTEIFTSIQGEGNHTGKNTVWIRFFLCNLQCNGFSQEDPTDEDTWELPWQEFDVSTVDNINELPVFDKGCDSSYSWAKKYKHLAHHKTIPEIADDIEEEMKSKYNPEGWFCNPHSRETAHLCITGGEPMLSQQAIIELLAEFKRRDNYPYEITIETNGTQKISDKLVDTIAEHLEMEGSWFWSCSPKLFTTSGEPFKRAIYPERLSEYYYKAYNKIGELNKETVGGDPDALLAMPEPKLDGQLKYVVNGTEDSWNEMEEITEKFRGVGINWPVWIMPVGATKEQQEDEQIAAIADEALERGYHVAARVHCYIWSNQIGT